MEQNVNAGTAELGNDEPLNELEANLFVCLTGEMSREDFLGSFLNSALYIMVDGEPVGGTLGDRKPLVIANGPGQPRLIAVFSHPSRAEKVLELSADYSFPVMVNAPWVLEHIGPHMGIAFNPGCHFGFEIAPDGAQQLKAALLQARQPDQ